MNFNNSLFSDGFLRTDNFLLGLIKMESGLIISYQTLFSDALGTSLAVALPFAPLYVSANR